ncbi:MFS transporter [Sphingomonas sp.]|uniref:AmpG family muropeptide MFS transporter n=1 Tax=Sphingomonas sp. TaxID=28214 RepID=UPI002600644F|nr:MFS transporter [Sphingomonas sp.]
MSEAVARPKGWRVFAAALSTRKSATMLAFGFSSGLPNALLIGTLTAWLGEAKINLATIGVLAWIGLSYSFKFLWSPLVDRTRPPLIGRIGRRTSWIVLCQALMILGLIGLASTDPAAHIARFALFAFAAAIGSATQDVAIDAWRIDVADGATPVEVLSSVYQLGYRTAAIVGGAGALFLAARMPWPSVYLVMAGLMAAMLVIALTAPDTERPVDDKADLLSEPGEIEPRTRAVALLVVGASWVWAIVTIVTFMASMLAPVPKGGKLPSASDFIKTFGPWIIVATIFVPLGVAALLNWLKARGQAVQTAPDSVVSPARTVANHLYRALVAPLADLTERMRWGVLLVIALILAYPFCYNIWGSFAYPFYLDFLHYSKDEVAFASKVFGIVMSIVGVSLGGYLFVKIGRFPTVLIGAILPIFGNFIYADLADGAPHIDAVLSITHLDALAAWAGSDQRMARLLLTIFYENISTGLAGAAFVAYVSGVVSKKYAAVQYALLSSLTFLIGSLGKGPAGEMIDQLGYATVFRYVSIGGALAILFVLLEWWRSTRVAAAAEPGHTGERA